ncbi:MAG: DUF3619 family protein [Burkholderiales bacterium]|jgi:hypothetical protein
MNEDDLARKIVARLSDHLDDLPQPILQRLRAVREGALAKTRPIAPRPAKARFGGGLPGLAPRLALSAAVIIATVAGLVYWQVSPHMEDDPEAGMLAGELPIHAYIDPGFETWLQNASHSPPQPAR